jgi:hypothetical protein
MKIHRMAFWPHYDRHIDPIWWKLPGDLRGDYLDGARQNLRKLPSEDVVLIAGAIDIQADTLRQIYIEHGAGQRYVDCKQSAMAYYSGGQHPGNVIGYICPNELVAQRWAPRPTFVAGCPPLESHWAAGINHVSYRRVAAITFHWDGADVCPEAGSALRFYEDDLTAIVSWLRDFNLEVVGHAHPRDTILPGLWKHLGIPFEPDPDMILRRCGVLIADNTSLLYEAAALGMQTLVLNCPLYRREVHHGLRFWDTVPGPMFDDAWDLMARAKPGHHDGYDMGRSTAAHLVYGPLGRNGSGGAAEWIVELVSAS